MTREEILTRLHDPATTYIYGRASYRGNKVTRILRDRLEIGKDGESLIHVFGCPGPDYDLYEFSDYGTTWGFTKGEVR